MVLFSIFFRDPERIIGKGVVAPADGKIQWIDHTENDDIGEYTRISTFMNMYNVHVNRMPLDGVIKDLVHQSGSHIPAFKKESERNEQITITMDTAIGIVKICQIAGTFGRRIVSYVKEGETIKKGERIGIIKFGSRVDLYLPSKKIKSICVKIRDKVLAGEDVIAYIYD